VLKPDTAAVPQLDGAADRRRPAADKRCGREQPPAAQPDKNHAMRSTPAHRPLPTRRRGFTLIELMIAVAIVALLASVALPSFLDSVRKGRRTEAFNAIANVQQAQERWRGNNANYADALATVGISSAVTTPAGYYTLALVTDSTTLAHTYIVTATANTGTSQANDGACAKLGVRVERDKIQYASCASCSSFASTDFADADACWKR
jgi:type IV pilus assembly protein PilE